MINGYKPKKNPDSVRDCLSNIKHDDLTLENSSSFTRSRVSHNDVKNPHVVFGLPTDTLNRKGGNLFHDNSKVKDIMAPKMSEMNSLSSEDMKSQRSRGEVKLLDKRIVGEYRS